MARLWLGGEDFGMSMAEWLSPDLDPIAFFSILFYFISVIVCNLFHLLFVAFRTALL